MSVAKNLRLLGSPDEGFLIRNGGRILGKNESDFLQTYHSVKLKGNLYLKDFTLKPKAKLFLSDQEMPYSFTDTYWSKSKKQVSHTIYSKQCYFHNINIFVLHILLILKETFL